MVPNGWENKTLETLCEPTAPITYGVLKPGDYVDGGTPLLQIKDLLNDLSDIDSLHRISHELDLEYRRSRIATNDILISLVGTVGRIGLVPEELNGANIHRNLGRIRTKNYEFLVHYLNSDIAKNKIGLSSSGSSQSALNLSVLKALKVPVPPLPEQRKIAQILSTWDRAIATTEKLIDASKQQKKALMQQLLTGKKRLIDPETGKAFEGEWEYKCLSRLTTIITNGFVGTATPYYTDESGVPYLYGLNVKNNKLNRKGLRYVTSEFHAKQTKSQLSEGDLLMVQSGHIGETAVVTKEFENSNCHALIVIKPKRNFVYPAFLSCYFNSEHGKYRLNCLEVGSTIMHINTKDMKKFVVPLPSLLEQQKIASVLTAADKEIELLEAKLAHLKQEKKALMQQLLTGKRRVSLSS
ncbi:restriction endonuclease subunit S [Photobacterium damselae]|uniref:restriction endonuclease subunit S n=1 Tax=Photobacterium damselae TaxID=38293 RepID=UPI00130274B2|nr:restriction endonuclease subunit S [Photobacterium damselae]